MDARIQKVFRDTLRDPKLNVPDTLSPLNTPAWDDFAHVRLVTALEAEFGLTFTMDELANVATVGDFARILKARGRSVD